MRNTGALLGLTALVWMGVGCGDDIDPGGGGGSLDDFLPDIPAPTGGAQEVFAGQIESADELIPGPASSGMVGDFYIRNAQGRFVVQAATRVIGVIPQGGNLVDATALLPDGNDASPDHFGELSMMYKLGRTCEHETIEVLQDGSGGGVAALRARGVARANDFISIKGLGLIPVDDDIDPDIDDAIECATTYILEPGADNLRVLWTMFNPGERTVDAPFATFSDTGGEVASWSPTRGFEEAGIDSLAGDSEAPIEYAVYQGPNVAYGMIPRIDADTASTDNAAFSVAGVSLIIFGSDSFLDLLADETYVVELEPSGGQTLGMDVVVGADQSAAESHFRGLTGETGVEISGAVNFVSGPPAGAARVGFFSDENGDGQLDEDDLIRGYADVDPNGAFRGQLLPGNYLVRADVTNEARSAVSAVTVGASGASDVSLELPDPVFFDYTITDNVSGDNIPGKIMIIGVHPAAPDSSVTPTKDVLGGLVNQIYSLRGTTIDQGNGADFPFALPPGTYKLLASRGTDWSVDAQVLTVNAGDPDQQVDFELRQVVDTTGYLATEYHVHSIGSPDSTVSELDRVKTAVADGVELFASTDHDFVSSLQHVVEALGLTDTVRSIPGIEVTPFAYGHFNAWPIEPIGDDPSGGAIDWARNAAGFALTPGELFDAMRTRGAELVQVNHPRSTGGGLSQFQQFFDRAELTFDYENRTISGDMLRQPVPNNFLRLPPGAQLFSSDFNALEVWNGFSVSDTNDDGVREIARLDLVMRDWFNFLSFGLAIAPIGNSDTHKIVQDPMGMPRTMVRVPDDSPTALMADSITDDIVDTLAGRGGVPVDVIVTNGPMLEITVDGDLTPLGKTFAPTGGVDITISAFAPDWAQFDTIEIFANTAPDVDEGESLLEPLACFTSRPQNEIMANDPCALAPLGGAQAMTVNLANVGAGYRRYQATVNLTVNASDIVNRDGASGQDAWFVIRVRGTRAIFPLLLSSGTLGDLSVLVNGSENEIDAYLSTVGVPAAAFSAPFYVDFDGGGYTAPFAPN